MARTARPRSERARRNGHAAPASAQPGRGAWLAPPIAAAVIVGLAYAAAQAQATADVFVVASLMFSVCEGVVLAIVGWAWSARGLGPAMLAATVTAAIAAPVRWEVGLLAGYVHAVQGLDFVVDLLVSVAWGALAGAAGATVLRSRLGTLMRNGQERFPRRPPS